MKLSGFFLSFFFPSLKKPTNESNISILPVSYMTAVIGMCMSAYVWPVYRIQLNQNTFASSSICLILFGAKIANYSFNHSKYEQMAKMIIIKRISSIRAKCVCIMLVCVYFWIESFMESIEMNRVDI